MTASVNNQHHRFPTRNLRQGMTLLEVLLALSLMVLVTTVIGALMNTYMFNENSGRDRVEQAKLARLTLEMIAEDIRCLIRPQNFDSSGLEQILGGSSGSGSSGGSSASSAASSSSMSLDSSNASSGTSVESDAMAATDTSSLLAGTEPGLYGTEMAIELDISRVPRPDEYFPMAADPNSGTIADMPSDVKTVSYFVQAAGVMGVQDPLGQSERLRTNQTTSALPTDSVTGLVRRSVDRSVTQYAYVNASGDSLQRTGEIIAPEVVGIEFQYFDGTMWQIQWDSSQLGLPTAVKVTIAVQRESKHQSMPYDAGGSLLNITPDILNEYGVELYSMNVIIPGVQLLPKPTSTTDATSSLGL